MHSIEVFRILPVIADEELRAAGILAAVRHREYAPVMILPRRIGFALDGISRAARTVAHRTSPLYHEPRYHAVER